MCGGRPARARPRQPARAAATRADRQRLCRAPPRRSIQWSAAKRMSPTPHCGTSLRHLTAQAIQSAVGARCSSALSRLPRQLPLAYVFVYSMYYSAPISLVLPLSQCPLLCPVWWPRGMVTFHSSSLIESAWLGSAAIADPHPACPRPPPLLASRAVRPCREARNGSLRSGLVLRGRRRCPQPSRPSRPARRGSQEQEGLRSVWRSTRGRWTTSKVT